MVVMISRKGLVSRTATTALVALVTSLVGSTAVAAPPSSGPTVSINDVSVTEGNSGTALASFTVQLKGKTSGPASVSYATADVTAGAPADYLYAGGTVTFGKGKARKVSVLVNGDLADEPSESFAVNLSGAINVSIADAQGIGTIVDDDAAPTISVADATVGEGNSGTTDASFRVALSNSSASEVRVDYSTADETATSPGDYAAGAGVVTFAPGTTAAAITVPVAGDTLEEPNETFAVNLSSPVGATLADGAATGTIVDDETVPAISVGDAATAEGDTGQTAVSFGVTLSHPSADTVSVGLATADGSAIAPADYLPAAEVVSFAPGETSKTVAVMVAGDAIDEPDESFAVNLSAPVNGLLADHQAAGTITDDDAAPSISVGDASVIEGNAGSKSVTVTVSLSNPSSHQVAVGYATADGTAVSPGDFEPASGTLLFGSGETQKTLAVSVLGDTAVEPDELLTIDAASAENAVLGDPSGGVTIANDGDRWPTATSVRARKARGKIRVSGLLSPAHPGRTMAVTLYKKKDGRFVKVRTKRPSLGAGADANADGTPDSKYSTRFRNPRRTRRCKVVARFNGDSDHRPSRAGKTFDC
jgi:hypothetical protein